MIPALFNIFSFLSYRLYVIVIFELYMTQIYKYGFEPTWPNQDTTCFRAALIHCFYVLF